jgi:hypothetical protein
LIEKEQPAPLCVNMCMSAEERRKDANSIPSDEHLIWLQVAKEASYI